MMVLFDYLKQLFVIHSSSLRQRWQILGLVTESLYPWNPIIQVNSD